MAFDLVLFGGTGDLSWRKLMPALFQAHRHGTLPAGGRILAVARDERSDDEYRQFIRSRFAEVESAKRPSDGEFDSFARLLHYRRMDLSHPDDYAGLRDWIDSRGAETVVLGDLGCMLNIEGRLRRRGDATRVLHVAEVLAGELPAQG